MEIQIKAWKLISSLETSGLEHAGNGLEGDGKAGIPFPVGELRDVDAQRGYGAAQCLEEAGPQLTAWSVFLNCTAPLVNVPTLPPRAWAQELLRNSPDHG